MCVADTSSFSTGHLSPYLPKEHARPQQPQPGPGPKQILSAPRGGRSTPTHGGGGLSPPSRTVLPARSLPRANQATWAPVNTEEPGHLCHLRHGDVAVAEPSGPCHCLRRCAL